METLTDTPDTPPPSSAPRDDAKLAKLRKEAADSAERFEAYTEEQADLEKRRRSLAARMVKHQPQSPSSQGARDELGKIAARIDELRDITAGFDELHSQAAAAVEAAELEARRNERRRINDRIRELVTEHSDLMKRGFVEPLQKIVSAAERDNEIQKEIMELRGQGGLSPANKGAFVDYAGKASQERFGRLLRGLLNTHGSFGCKNEADVHRDHAHFLAGDAEAMTGLEIPSDAPFPPTPTKENNT